MKTVLHIFSGDLWAGAEVMIANLLRQLHKDQRLRVIALALNQGTLVDVLRRDGIAVHVIPESEHSLVGIYARARALLKSEDIYIIHAHRHKENLLAWFLARGIGAEYTVTTIHGLPEPRPARAASTPGKVRDVLHRLVLKRSFSDVVAVSFDMKQVLVDRWRFRENLVKVIHNGIPVEHFGHRPVEGDMQPERNQYHVGTVGRLVPVKDYALFLEVAALIRAKDGTARFSILGDGPLREELVGKAHDLGLGDAFEILPPVSDPRGYYRSLDVYLNTSIHEGIPLSILEAMATGIPVVAPAVGGIPEVIRDGTEGALVRSRRPEGFANAVLALLKDRSARQSKIEAAMHRVKDDFSDTAMAVRYSSLYLGHN